MGTNHRITQAWHKHCDRSGCGGRAPAAMRRALVALFAASLIPLLIAPVSAAAQTREMRRPEAEAGRRPGSAARGSKPALVWLDGVLTMDRVGAWMLTNGTPLKIMPETRWRDEATGREASPSSGRTVRLMGQWRRGVFQVRQATLIPQQRVLERLRQVPEAGAALEEDPGDMPH